MSTHDDDRFSVLLTDAVAEVEPSDRIDVIRARVASQPRSRRGWWIAGGGGALAVAATVAAVALTSTPQPTAGRDLPVGSGSPSPTSPASPSVTGSAEPVEKAGTPFTAYYVGDGPSGPRLFGEATAADGADPFASALDALMSAPTDPDYRSLWPEGSLTSATFDGIGNDGIYSVTLADESWTQRPAGMSDAEARMAIQAVVYTLQDRGGAAQAPVNFYVDHRVVDSVLGVPADGNQYAAAPALDTLNLVNLTTPAEDDAVNGALAVEGLANSFEANVLWRLEDAGGTVVDDGFFTARGWMDTKLFPFEGSIDVSSLDPGTYTLIVSTDDPSGGAEGDGPATDTRTITVV